MSYSPGVRSPTGTLLEATAARTARMTQRCHGVAVIGTGQAVQDKVDRVADVEDRLCREQLVADPERRRTVLGVPPSVTPIYQVF